MVAYTWPRALRASSWACPSVQPQTGVVAGDTFATVLIMAHCMRAFQEFSESLPAQCALYTHVGYTAIQIAAPRGHIVGLVVRTTASLQRLLRGELCCVLNDSKTVVVASSRSLSRFLQSELGIGTPQPHARYLGSNTRWVAGARLSEVLPCFRSACGAYCAERSSPSVSRAVPLRSRSTLHCQPAARHGVRRSRAMSQQHRA